MTGQPRVRPAADATLASPPAPGGAPEARPLLARDAELAAWADAVQLCRAGSGSVVLVTGEAGIGKTRLVEECLRRTGGPVHLVLGACPPVAGTDLPYVSVRQGLRGLRRTVSPAQQELLAAWTGADPAGDPAGAGAGSRTGQVRLFEGLVGVLSGLAAERPVLFVVEDLHWADRSTLDLLAFLAGSARSDRLLLLLTTRDDLPRDSALRPWLAELARLPHTTVLPLARLGPQDTVALLQQRLGAAPAPGLADAVHRRAEGNPLFTELLMPDVEAGRLELPPLLRDLLTVRFARLGADARRLLALAATVGRTVGDDLLVATSGLGEDDGGRALHELVDQQVLRPDRDGERVEFVHELLREAAYAELLPGERRRLHRRLADAMVLAEPAPEAAGEIAHHYLAAGAVAQALPLTVRAGLAAGQAYAHAEALGLLRQADALWDRVPDAEQVSPLGRSALLAAAAAAADLVGDAADAVHLVTRALALADPGDVAERARLHERCGTYNFHGGHADAAQTAFAQALELLPAEPPSAVRAEVLASLALLAMAWTRLDEAAATAAQAVAAAQAARAQRQESRARNALGVVLAWQGDLAAGIAELRAAADLARAVDDRDDLAAATINLGHVLGVAGWHDEAVQTCLQGYEEACRAGLEREHGSFLLANAAAALLRAGRWAEADRLLRRARERAPRGLRAFTGLLQSAWLATRRGDLEHAGELVAAAQGLLDDAGGGQPSWRRELLEVAAELHVLRGCRAEAAAAVEEALALTEQAGEPRSAGPLLLSGLRSAADAAEHARAVRDAAAEAAARTAGESLHARALALDPCPFDVGRGALPEAGALATARDGELGRLRGSADALAWTRAADAWRRLERPYEAAYAQWRAAEALFAAGDGAGAAASLLAAHRGAAVLGASGLVEELRALAHGQRVALDVVDAAPSTAAEHTLGLTPRELEVLTRVTAGQTNRQIAEGLFISVKTASVHVSNILRKLDVGRREDAARIGRQIGLIPRPRRADSPALPPSG